MTKDVLEAGKIALEMLIVVPEGPVILLDVVLVTDGVLPFDAWDAAWDAACGLLLVIEAEGGVKIHALPNICSNDPHHLLHPRR